MSVGGSGQHDFLLHPIVNELPVLFQGGAEKGLSRQEQHHQFQLGPHLLPVFAFGQLIHVAAHQPPVRRQRFGSLLFRFLRIDRVKEGLQRNLGVDGDAAIAGKIHDHIGPLPPGIPW